MLGHVPLEQFKILRRKDRNGHRDDVPERAKLGIFALEARRAPTRRQRRKQRLDEAADSDVYIFAVRDEHFGRPRIDQRIQNARKAIYDDGNGRENPRVGRRVGTLKALRLHTPQLIFPSIWYKELKQAHDGVDHGEEVGYVNFEVPVESF